MTDTARVAEVLEQLTNRADRYGKYLAEHTDYWEGGGSPMESHYELLDEGDALVKALRARQSKTPDLQGGE